MSMDTRVWLIVVGVPCAGSFRRFGVASQAWVLGAMAALLGTGLPTAAFAQRELPLAQTALEFIPASAVDTDADLKIASTRWATRFLVPVPVTERTLMLISPRYSLWRFTSDDVEDRSIHDIGCNVTGRYRRSERWTFISSVGFGVASDFRDVDADHLRFTGALSGERTVSPELRMGLGVVASYNFGELLPLPLLNASWLPNERLHIFASLPFLAGMNIRWTDRLRTELRATLVGNRFSIGDTTPPVVESLSVSSGQLEARIGTRLFGNLWGFASVGYTAFRRLEAFDEAENQTADLTPERAVTSALTLEVRLPVRPPAPVK